MAKEQALSEDELLREVRRIWSHLPRPSPQFQRRAWLAFQRALDPLAPPKSLKRR